MSHNGRNMSGNQSLTYHHKTRLGFSNVSESFYNCVIDVPQIGTNNINLSLFDISCCGIPFYQTVSFFCFTLFNVHV